ncbi:hypothetical protein [Mucilaginibacter sp. KACC 22063]|uniref:hypothetical protein n=1 Tax=Mucilaginibacter sp. KACC 22063 TaxID=3025666 RepID=UPI00236693FD|nr:hypothetical protein [Mucilaginibacter sp. KACC 22063]WDF57207.1 hypothetical protein PQ461_09085 [Mucilaginibacter sp. KACC 22063]
MKPLNKFTNIDKAKLLHELLPEEIAPLLDRIQAVCDDLKTNQDEHRRTCDFGLMTFDMWLQLSEQVNERIKKYRPNLVKSSKIFSEQLFGSFDYTVIFVNDRVVKYAAHSCQDEKFKKAVDLLFNL